MSDFKAKCTKIQNSAGALPQTLSLQRSPDPLAGFKGPTSKGREWRGEDGTGEEESVFWSPTILKIDPATLYGHV